LVAVARQKGFEVQNLSGLVTRDFAEVFCQALRDINYVILRRRMVNIRLTASAFAELGVDEEVLKRIAKVFVGAVLKEVREVMSSHSLEQATIEDLVRLFHGVLMFADGSDLLYAGQDFLQAGIMALNMSLVDNFEKEYFSRLSKALAVKEWSPAAPQQTHLRIIGTLTMSKATSLSLGGDTYEATQALLILLEFTSGCLQITPVCHILSDNVMKMLFGHVHVFSYSSSGELLKREDGVTPAMLSLAASGLAFYGRLVPFIESWFIRNGADTDRAKDYCDKATLELNMSHNEVMTRLATLPLNRDVAGRTASKRAAEIADDAFTGNNGGSIDQRPFGQGAAKLA
jgi:hypothetical protein